MKFAQVGEYHETIFFIKKMLKKIFIKKLFIKKILFRMGGVKPPPQQFFLSNFYKRRN